MLSPYNSNGRRYPYGPRVINRNSLVNTDITGSLIGIEEPEKIITTSSRRPVYTDGLINNKQNTEQITTSSLSEIKEPEKLFISPTKTAENIPKIINKHVLDTELNENILKFSSKEIRKSITSFNSDLNQLYISASYIDDSIEPVSKDYFEVYYNGMRAPDKFNVEQSGSVVVITFTDVYLNYENLQLSEIFVIGKFR